MHALLAFAAAVALPQAAAQADDWWLVSFGGEKPSRLVVFMDKGSIEKGADNNVRMRELDYQEAAGTASSYSIAQLDYDCAGRTFRTISQMSFAADGVPLPHQTAAGDASATAVVPGTMGAKELDFACGKPQADAAKLVGANNLVTVGRAILGALDRGDGQLGMAQ